MYKWLGREFNCALKLFLLENLSNQFDLITSSLDSLIFNVNLSLILLHDGIIRGVVDHKHATLAWVGLGLA